MPQLPFKFPKTWSKQAREDAKLDRIAARRLASPTSFRPRGVPFDNSATLQPESLDQQTMMNRRKSTVSLASTGSAMRKIGEGFRSAQREHHSLKVDYRNLIKLLDNLDYVGWRRLANHLEKDVVKEKLMDSTDMSYPEEIRDLSHQLIFRFVMVGFITFLASDQDGSDTGSHPKSEETFIIKHNQYLARNHPAAFLGVWMCSEHHHDLRTFEDVIGNQFEDTDSELPEVLHESMVMIQKYTRRFNGIAVSVQRHARYILNTLVHIGTDRDFTDFSTFVGLLPWLYFKLDPEVTDREWIPHTLRVDQKYWKAIEQVYEEPIARWKAVCNLGKYYEEDREENTVLHLMLYLWTMKHFDVHPSSPPEGAEKFPLYDCRENILKEFSPGSWRSQTYYVCTEGDTLLWAMNELTGNEDQNALLSRFIIHNLDNWTPVTESSELHLGMIRTLYLSLRSCGVKKLLKECEKGVVSALGWRLGKYFQNPPMEFTYKRLEKKDKRMSTVNPTQLDIEIKDTITAILSVLEVKNGYDIPGEEIPLPSDLGDAKERWKVQVKLSVAILKKVIVEGNEETSLEIFQALKELDRLKEDETYQVLSFLIEQLGGQRSGGEVDGLDAEVGKLEIMG